MCERERHRDEQTRRGKNHGHEVDAAHRAGGGARYHHCRGAPDNRGSNGVVAKRAQPAGHRLKQQVREASYHQRNEIERREEEERDC